MLLKDLQRKLRVPPMKLERTLKSLERQGFVFVRKLPGAEVDGTGRKSPGTTYVDLLSQNFRFTGRNPTQQKRLKHTKGGGPRKKETDEYDGPMFG